MGKDVEFLLGVLSDGREHELGKILQRSIDERGHGLTVHSRAADLRKRGYKVKNRVKRLESGRTASFYQLLRVPELEETPAPASASPVGVSSSPGDPARVGGGGDSVLGPDGAASSSPSRLTFADLGLSHDPESDPDLAVAPPDGLREPVQLSLGEAA